MHRLVLIGAALAGGCGVTDDRPRTLSYITDTILAPTCASAECHSAFRQQVGDQFDTVAATRQSIVANALVAYPLDTSRPDRSYLIQTLTIGTPSLLNPGSGNVRMPYDAPMPDADVALISAWIAEGAPGAQCLPNADGLGCTVDTGPADRLQYHVVECSPDGNAGRVVMDCTADQACTYFGGNGQCR